MFSFTPNVPSVVAEMYEAERVATPTGYSLARAAAVGGDVSTLS